MEKSKEIKKMYNEQFGAYSKKQNEYKVIIDLRKRVTSLLGAVKGKKVLFAGCGDGTECIGAVKNGAIVTGIDLSKSAVKLARKNIPDATFDVGDFEKTKFVNGAFDIVVSILSVMYKENLTVVLKEFRRILRKGGSIVIVVPHPTRKMLKYNSMNYFVRGWRKENWRGIRRFNYYRLFEDYIDAFTNSNLRLIRLIEPRPVKETKATPEKEVSHPHFVIFKLAKL